MEKVPDRDTAVFRCKFCGWECRKKLISGSDVPLTKQGAYSEATPPPATFADEMYEATSISFVAASGDDPAYLADSKNLFSEKHFSGGMTIRIVTDSETNDGDYTISDRGVTRSKILLDESLTDEDATIAGTVVISRVIYKPEITQGCPFCGSLHNK